jgi:hypothetical protein
MLEVTKTFIGKVDWPGVIAGILGALVAIGLIPQLSWRLALTTLAAGLAVNVYLAPMALYFAGIAMDHPVARSVGFIAGLLGMRVIVVFKTWADKIEKPGDFLDFKKDD